MREVSVLSHTVGSEKGHVTDDLVNDVAFCAPQAFHTGSPCLQRPTVNERTRFELSNSDSDRFEKGGDFSNNWFCYVDNFGADRCHNFHRGSCSQCGGFGQHGGDWCCNFMKGSFHSMHYGSENDTEMCFWFSWSRYWMLLVVDDWYFDNKFRMSCCLVVCYGDFLRSCVWFDNQWLLMGHHFMDSGGLMDRFDSWQLVDWFMDNGLVCNHLHSWQLREYHLLDHFG